MAGSLHELTIAAPAEKVFRARTGKEGLSGWWTPGVTAQPKVGTIAESPFPEIVLKLKVERLEAGRNVTRSVVE